MRFLISVFVAALLAATQATAEPEAIEFSDLADPFAVAFEDPYAAMGVDMLNELKLLVQSDEKLAGADLDEKTRTRLEARRTAAQDKLEANGHDVDALLGQRWDVAKKRQTARMATNPIFDSVEVSLSGYIIPGPKASDGSGFGGSCNGVAESVRVAMVGSSTANSSSPRRATSSCSRARSVRRSATWHSMASPARCPRW